MDDPNINPAWDSILGDDTDGAVMRLVAIIAVFTLLGGTFFWLIA